MDYLTKTCPRCRAQLRQGDSALELVKKGTTGVEHTPGLTVIPYLCPKCGYIELYSLKVAGGI